MVPNEADRAAVRERLSRIEALTEANTEEHTEISNKLDKILEHVGQHAVEIAKNQMCIRNNKGTLKSLWKALGLAGAAMVAGLIKVFFI